MSKLCKRIIALCACVCLVLVNSPLAFAVSSENQATFWEAWLACLAGAYDPADILHGWSTGDLIGNFISPDTVCPRSSDGYHHGSQVDGLVDGRAKVKCSECGQWFYYSASDLENQYNNSVHDYGLDNGPQPRSSNVSYTGHWKSDCPYILSGSNVKFGEHHYREYVKSDSSTYFCTMAVFLNAQYKSNQFVIVDKNTIFNLNTTGNSITFKFLYQGCAFKFVMGYGFSDYDNLYSLNPVIYSYITNNPDCSYYGNYESDIPLSGSSNYHSLLRSLVSRYYVFDSLPSGYVPTNITVNNNNYNVTNFDFDLRQYHTTNENNDNITITYEDNRVTIHNETTDETSYNYYYIETDPGNDDPDPGSSSDPGGSSSVDPDPGSSIDPGPGDGSSSTSGGGAAGSDGSGCCEQCALLLRQVNQYLLQIQTLVDEINDKLGPDSDNYMQGIYNLLIEINDALDNLSESPHDEYEQLLTTIANQLANIWGDLDDIKDTLESVDENTATTNDKLDTVHDDLAAVLSELQTQRGILQQILSVLRDMLRHVVNIDGNVEDLATEEQQQSFVGTLYSKFGFINQVYTITRQMVADVTNDAVSANAVADGVIPALDLTSDHADPDSSGGSGDVSAQSVNAGSDSSVPRSGGTAPEIVTSFPDVEVLGFNLSSYSAIDMSWYAPYKREVDSIISGFLYLGYIWLLFKRLPAIIQGGAMASSDYDKVQWEYFGNKRGD